MDTPFPRGKGDNNDSIQKRKKTEDDLFQNKRVKRIEVVASKSFKNNKKKEEKVVAALLPQLVSETQIGLGMTMPLTNSKSLKIVNVSFSKYAVGSLALGYVLKLNDDAAVISLPGGVTGAVMLDEISDYCHRVSSVLNEVVDMHLLNNFLLLYCSMLH